MNHDTTHKVSLTNCLQWCVPTLLCYIMSELEKKYSRRFNILYEAFWNNIINLKLNDCYLLACCYFKVLFSYIYIYIKLLMISHITWNIYKSFSFIWLWVVLIVLISTSSINKLNYLSYSSLIHIIASIWFN